MVLYRLVALSIRFVVLCRFRFVVLYRLALLATSMALLYVDGAVLVLLWLL